MLSKRQQAWCWLICKLLLLKISGGLRSACCLRLPKRIPTGFLQLSLLLMNIYVTILLTSSIAGLTTAITWLIMRRFSSTTKGAWSLAIAIGYGVGHVGYLASAAVAPELELSVAVTQWANQIPGFFSAVIWPTEVLNWLPIGVLLAGLVSANSAVFPFDRSITIFGAALVSFWLGLQLIGGVSTMQGNWFSVGHGGRIAIGTLTLLLCWMSLQNSIQGKSRKVWIGCVTVLSISVVGVLALTGSRSLFVLGSVLLGAMLGGIGASLLRSAGTDNIRFSGAVISCICVSLLLVAWWSGISWYPIAFLIPGFLFVNSWLPSALSSQKKRASMAVGCSLASLCVAALVRYGVI